MIGSSAKPKDRVIAYSGYNDQKVLVVNTRGPGMWPMFMCRGFLWRVDTCLPVCGGFTNRADRSLHTYRHYGYPQATVSVLADNVRVEIFDYSVLEPLSYC